MGEVTRGYWAAVVCNADFICVDTWSGYRGGTDRDPKGKQHLLSSDACDLALGEAVLDALAHSRWVLPAPREGVTFPEGVEFDMAVCDFKVNYPACVNALMEICGYKNKRALFKNMKRVSLESKNGVLTLTPWHHAKLEAWDGVGDEATVVIPATSTPEEIGAALRLALSRCT
ncbi:contact-dependent growth inhibition system immunity protein [Desulfovibrio subterraneus]|nr:contact-dependent growth inhibition system immunity protein [Desulfovibrio subterraneus]